MIYFDYLITASNIKVHQAETFEMATMNDVFASDYKNKSQNLIFT